MSFPGHISRVSHFDSSRYQNKHTNTYKPNNKKADVLKHRLQAKHAARLAQVQKCDTFFGVVTHHESKKPTPAFCVTPCVDQPHVEPKVSDFNAVIDRIQAEFKGYNVQIVKSPSVENAMLLCSTTASTVALIILVTRTFR